MSNDHTAAAFDRDLEAIQTQVMRMGGMVEQAIRDSAMALEMRDEEMAEKVRQDDLAIDELQEQINEAVARLIALRAPLAVDLRLILSVLKISGNLERIGDYAKNMAKRTNVLAQLPEIDGATAALRRMSREVGLMLKDGLDAYLHRDTDLAEDVIQRDHDVDQMYNALFREFITHMMEDPRHITPCMHLHFIAKNVERMGDHVTAIAEQVIYLVTGEIPGTKRPKSDETSHNPDLTPNMD